MRIGSTIEQQFGDIVMVVIEGDHQRRHAFRRRHIHIGAGRDQRLDAVVAAVARRIQQRGQSPDGTILRARLRRNLARPVAVQRPRLDVGAFGKQQLHHLARIFRRGGRPHQRRLIVKLLHRVDVGAGFDQHFDDGQFAGLDRQHQRGLAVQIGALGSRTGVEQRLHHPGIGELDGFGERRRSELIGDIDFRLLRDQRVEQFVVDLVDRPVDRAGAVGLRFIHIRARSNLLERRLAISRLNEIGERVRLGACAQTDAAAAITQKTARMKRFIRCASLNDIRVQFVMVSPQTLGRVVQEFVRIFPGSREALQNAALQHVLGTVAFANLFRKDALELLPSCRAPL